VNWLHDRWYEAGFDEASGNAQQDNFGLGGIGGDPILAEGNDFSGRDNANMSTPPDGSSPRMQMYRFDGPNPLPSRTSNHEALITFHEMGHYITNRLVGNASGLMNAQGRAMGEGWGDFFAVCMTSQATDDFASGTFAVGGWTDVTPTFKENYYYSIRRYPYSADMTKSPLTFKHISANVLLPVGPQRNPNGGGGNQEAHNAGEIWSCALWECFINLVAAHGHAEAEPRMLRYVIGGLKLTPSNPTFLQARDGILSAAAALEPADVPVLWKGFAKRGMGKDAVAPAATSVNLTGVVESFDVP
jgi:extracellular elastinolytic metalloproteinase